MRRFPRTKAILASLVGLGTAIFWHFAHAAQESYTASLNDSHFWFHLLIEGIIALYAFAMTLLVWIVLERIYK
jgi:hypothetical protein